MEYQVEDSDTVERIAARFECTVGQLMKMNRMNSRMVFVGQTLIVPSPISDDVFEESKGQNGLFPSPGTAVQVAPQQPVVQQRSRPVTKTKSEPVTTATVNKSPKHSLAETYVDCLKRFLKVKVKNVTERDGTVSGTLLITPNAIMFDPDVNHPLVKENGQDLYMMMAPMADITSVAVFRDIGALTGEKDQDKDIYDPDHISKLAGSGKDGENINNRRDASEKDVTSPVSTTEVYKGTSDKSADQTHDCAKACGLGGSESQLPLIAEEGQKIDIELDLPIVNRRTVSDVGSPPVLSGGESFDDNKIASSSLQRGFFGHYSEITPSTSRTTSKGTPAVGSKSSLVKLSRTLSAHASSIRDSAEKVTHSAVTGTKSMAHGVVTHTKLAAETLHTGIQSGAKLAATHAKVAVDAMASVPQGIVNMSTGLFTEGQQTGSDVTETVKDTRTAASVRRQQSLATLENLKQRTLQAREQASKDREASLFTCAVSPEDKPELFRPVQEIVNEAMRKNNAIAPLVTTELPYYMAVRINRRKQKAKHSRSTSTTNSTSSASEFDGELIGNRTRREFWFAIPRERVDGIYHFLLQCNPDKYGQEVVGEEADVDDAYSSPVSGYRFYDNSFIVLDSEVDEKLAGKRLHFLQLFQH